jgi:threonine synthase
MLRFISTRGSIPVPLEKVLFRGLAPDGGLYMPTSIPSLAGNPDSEEQDFRVTAAWASSRLFSAQLGETEAIRLALETLDFPVPLVEVHPGIHVLELFRGPTHAFKDVGGQFMAGLMQYIGSSNSDKRTTTILVATSGDTGGAVARAFHGRPKTRVVVLFPDEGISLQQRRQMSTLGDNVLAIAVAGTFDHCQELVKEAFASDTLRDRYCLTSGNSINLGRLLPQMFYYLHATRLLSPAPAFFAVPSGNLGNLCAGLLAHIAGMPARGFLSGMNANDAFGRFLATGNLSERPSVPTISSAMDVGKPSNLERIRWLFREHPNQMKDIIRSASINDSETRRCITEVYEETGYILDPHSAVAYWVARRHHDLEVGPSVVLATAHPAKFPGVVETAINSKVEPPQELLSVMTRKELFSEIKPTLQELEALLDEIILDD